MHEIYEFTPDIVEKDPDLKMSGSLDPSLIEEIVDCLFVSREDDILPTHKKLLKPPMKEALRKLKEKFGKKH